MADLEFEYGDANSPRGHAVVYFRDNDNILASYIVILPTELDLTRYIPPFLASNLKNMQSGGKLQPFAAPPMPEPIDSLDEMIKLAQQREDDLLFGGDIDSSNTSESIEKLNAISASYNEICVANGATLGAKAGYEGEVIPLGGSADAPADTTGRDGALSDEDKLQKLTALLGQLRYAVESGDKTQADALKKEILDLSKTMSDTMKIDELVRHGASTAPAAAELAGLYLERAYEMQKEAYLKVKEIEDKIAQITSETAN